MNRDETIKDYAVEIRYPDFWLEPEIEDAKEALETAKKVKEFVFDKLKGRHTDNS